MQNSQTNTFLKGMNLDTAKEFIGSDQYIDALDVHINTDAGATAGALQPYLDVIIDKANDSLVGQEILGATTGHFGKDKKNCYIVLSYDETNDDEENWLSVFDEETNELLWKLVIPDLNCKTRVKLVNLWEDEKKSSVYISSEDSYIQVVNINQSYGTVEGVVNKVDGYDFSIFPKCGALQPFKFHKTVKGNKVAGKIQYAYQLFNLSGQTTALSAISYTIPIGSELQNDKTAEGVCISLVGNFSAYSHIRIFALVYTNFEDIPRVYIKDEIQIDPTSETFYYCDSTDDYLSELTIEEFQAIKNFVFRAATVEQKDNRLFAAGITEDTWDVTFDARVYSADKSGFVDFTGILGNEYHVTLQDIVEGKHVIPEQDSYNNPDPETYKYNTYFGEKTNFETVQSESSEHTLRKFQDILSNVITAAEFNDYEIVDDGYSYATYLDDEIVKEQLGEITLTYFPLRLLYWSDFVVHNSSFCERFWCGLDVENKKIHVISTISYSDKSIQDLYDTDRVWQSYVSNICYNVKYDDTVAFGKYSLTPTDEIDIPTAYPYGGAGPKISYMFVRPLLYLSPNASTNTVDSGLRLLSKDTLQAEYGDMTEIKILSDTISGNGWETVTAIKKDASEHTVKNITYADPYICANYTGFKQGECYTFGIVFYNQQHIPSPVHYIGTITIPYFENWIYGGVKRKDGGTHDLLATTVGIRFRVDLSNMNADDVSAYEIVRVQKTTETRKVLMQGIVSNTVEYVKKVGSGGQSLGDSDLRAPLYPTTSQYFYNLFRAGQDSNNSSTLTTISDYTVFVSPEISVNKENVEKSFNNAKQLYVHNQLSSILYDSRNLDEDNNFVTESTFNGAQYIRIPIYKHITYMTVPGTSYTLADETYKHNAVSGVPFGQFILAGSDPQEQEYLGTASSWNNTEIGYGLFKYYLSSPMLSENRRVGIDSVKFCKTISADQLGDSSTQFAATIGDKQFVNVAELNNTGDAGRLGIHCNCVVIKLMDNLLTSDDTPSDESNTMTTDSILMNLNWDESDNLSSYKRIDPLVTDNLEYSSYSMYADLWPRESVKYNVWGTSRCSVALADICTGYVDSIQHSLIPTLSYVSTGQYCTIDRSQSTQYINCFGGDTYVCIHKELWSGFGYDQTYTNDSLKYKDCINIKYPVETRINLDRVKGPNFDTNQPNPTLTFEPGQLLKFGAQELPLNAYNDAYSAQEYNKVFVTEGAYDIANQKIGNRIMASEVKSTGELTDSFQDFKVANYIDVDGQYGPITNLVKYNGRLYYLQSTAFGTVSVNERSLITDNNNAQLLLGTGDVLQRYDYISTFNGSKELNDPSIVVSPSSLYWYDSNKKSIQVFNQGGLNSLSKVKNVQSYFDKQVGNKLVHSGYDMKYNEVWFSPEEGDKSIIYSEQAQAFIGFYSKTLKYPKVGDRFSLGLTDNNKFIHFGECDGHINTEHSLRYVEFVVNQNAGMPKVFDTFSVNDCIRPMSDEASWFGVKFSTNRQGEARQTRPVNKEGVYYMPIGRDSNKERMRDKIMTVKLTLDTTEFSIPSVSTMFRYSRI